MRWVLIWSEEKKILQNKLDLYEHFWALKDYSKDAVWAMVDALRFEWYLYKTNGQYPMLGISELGSAVIIRNKALKEALEELNTYVVWKVWLNLHKSVSSSWTKKESKPRWNTYKETLELVKKYKDLDFKKLIKKLESERDLKQITLEAHIVKLYEDNQLSFNRYIEINKFS